jgi:D-xylose transport system ATP-binding protein
MRNIVKEFPGVRALDGVSFTLEPGEVHALVGENGAGKSTLMKVLSGVYPGGSFDGEIAIDGEQHRFANVRDSENAGIAVIFQELSLVKELTVGENIFLGREPSRFGVIDTSELYRRASAALRELDLDLDPRVSLGRLGIGKQQLVEIAKALSRDARILVLDEPTAALTEHETETLFRVIRSLRARGVGMIYISHKLDEVFTLADRITVLRDGKTVASFASREATKDALIAAMVGREVNAIFPEVRHSLGDVALRVSHLTATAPERSDKKVVDDVSFEVRQGEVLAIAGLMGAGRTEVLTALFGGWSGRFSSSVEIRGRRVVINSPSDAIREGIALVTEDRKRTGLIIDQSILNNMTLPAMKDVSGRFVRDRYREAQAVAAPMSSLRVKAASSRAVVGSLSGGNQQKVVLGKWLLTNPKVLLLDEPTRGIDVGAKQEIYAEINKLAADGLAIVLVSSELPEVLGLSDRILVLYKGRIAAEFSRESATAEKVMAAATGQI